MALVDNPQARFCQYVQTQYGITLLNCSVLAATDTNIASEITFPPNTPSATVAAVISDAQSPPAAFGGWTPIALPDLVNFKETMLADTNIPNSAKLALYSYDAVLDDLANLPTQLQPVWAFIKSEIAQPASGTIPAGPLSGLCNDGTTQITAQIETYAAVNGIMLVPAQ
jgi:hypothetical protein